MIIHSGGKLVRKFIHTDAGNEDGREEPAMVLYRPSVKGKCAIIPLSCAYKYDEPTTRAEKAGVFHASMAIAKALDYPLTGQSAAQIAMTIQDGLDELVRMPPKRLEKKVIGEGCVTCDGKKHSFEVTR